MRRTVIVFCITALRAEVSALPTTGQGRERGGAARSSDIALNGGPRRLECAERPWTEGCPCRAPGGATDENISPILPGECTDDWSSADPRFFGPVLWKAFHLIAANFADPPTDKAVKACAAFIRALPYMIPCSHCAWHFGQFIQLNTQMSGQYDYNCAGACATSPVAHAADCPREDWECLSPELACRSQRSLVSFLARAHNNVNRNTNPCRAPYTTAAALAQYVNTGAGFCARNIVWGDMQICRGPYCSSGDGEECNSGPSGSGGATEYYGIANNETCGPAVAVGCGSHTCNGEQLKSGCPVGSDPTKAACCLPVGCSDSSCTCCGNGQFSGVPACPPGRAK